MALSRALAVALGACAVAPANAGCANSRWTDAYSEERCHVNGNAAEVQCLGRSGAQCGMRMESSFSSGMGSHSMGIKAAPGPGVVTTFYLSNNGGLYDKSCTSPWVELDYEIMGNQVGPQSKIWTNMFTGTCQEHWQWITVPFDVSAGYHTYAFDITDDTVSWVVDGVAYRTESIAHHSDVRGSAHSNSFREFVSVWGKSSSEPGEGIPEFQDALGKLDYNTHTFPLLAGFKRDASHGGAPAPLPGHEDPPAQCAQRTAPWHSCSDSKCCVEGYTCFEKNDHYAQCRLSCSPGVHEDDLPGHRTPWSCAVLSPAPGQPSPPAPTPAPRPPSPPAPGAPSPILPPAPSPMTCSGGSELWHSCQDSKCCADSSVCFEKDVHYAQCRPSCIPGIHHEDKPEYQTPWSCRVLSPATRRLSLQFMV